MVGTEWGTERCHWGDQGVPPSIHSIHVKGKEQETCWHVVSRGTFQIEGS